MSGRETESFIRYKEEAKPLILALIEEHSFLSLRSLQILLEQQNYWHTVTWNAIRDLKRDNLLRTAKYPPRGNFPQWIYKFNLRINDIKQQIDAEYKPLYQEFIEKSSSMGRYCEKIIESAFTEVGFINLSKNENTKYFRGRTYHGRKDIDIVAYREGVFYGIEIKNRISYPNWDDDIINKKLVADYHGIQFVLLSRELGPYGYRLFRCGGLHIEFQKLIWSPNFSSLAERIEEKLFFPIICVDEPTEEIISKIKQIPLYHDRHFYGKRRI